MTPAHRLGERPPGRLARPAALLLLGLTTSCASYPERTADVMGVFQSGRFEEAADRYADTETTGSVFLSGAEAGSAAFAAGDWDRSLELFGSAADYSREAEDAALISPESLGESVLAFAVSESAADYNGEGYERVQLHAGMAMAYLAKGQFESARVEVRRANKLLESEEKLYEKSYAAGGLGHVVSAATYELEGSYDDAWIDYMRMMSKGVGTEVAGPALVRIARRSGREAEIPDIMERYGDAESPPRDAAQVVVIGGLGLGPSKRAATLPIPTGDGILQWSVPAYVERPQLVPALTLTSTGKPHAVTTASVEDVTTVAKENLDDRLAWLAARSAIRAIAKRELTQHLEDKWGGWGLVAGNVFTMVTERADLRAWQTLPSSWHAARLFVPADEHEFVMTGSNLRADLGRFRLTEGETMFVFVRQVGSTLAAHTVGGERLDLPPAPFPIEATEEPPSTFEPVAPAVEVVPSS